MKTRIIVDSTADLMPEYKSRVSVVPLTVHFGEEEYIDGVMILFCDGSICTSSVSAKILNERAKNLAKEIKVVVVKSEDELD